LRIVVLDGFAADQGELGWDDLARLGEVTVHARTAPDEIVARATGAAAVLTNKVVLTRAVIEKLPELKYVGIVATGTNVVDFDACRERGIAVTNAPGYCSEAVAQFVFAFLLHALEDIAPYVVDVKSGGWSRAPDYCYFLHRHIELAGKNLAVLGMGNIGKRVADLGRAFGMNVMATAVPGGTSEGRTELETAIPRADVVSLHCPLTEKTRGLVDRAFLAAMKPDAILINTSRGPLIDEGALLEALPRGRPGAVLLDVLGEEPPPPDHPLTDPRAPWAGRVLVTPHIAWGKVEARQRLIDLVSENLAAFLRGERKNRVDSSSSS
jgi:glycerate dehydrogenase